MTVPLAIVGGGRLGRSAGALLRKRCPSQEFVLVASRNDEIPRARVTWITVADRDISAAAEAVPVGGIVLHASGALKHREALGHRHALTGSLHPLMTFPGPEIGMPKGEIPAAVSGETELVMRAAEELGASMGFSHFRVAEESRALYHASAVTAGNFATALLVHAGRMLPGVSDAEARSLLAPLAIASIENAVEHGADALTGPIARGDAETISKHRSAIADLPGASDMYDAMCKATREATGKVN